MKHLMWTALVLPLGVMPAFAQSRPATTPSTPQVTTPPPPGVQPPTGGPNSLPTTEPPNIIDRSAVDPGVNAFTETQARNRLLALGYCEVSALTKGGDGIWRGTATRNGEPVRVAVDGNGAISSN